MSSRILIVEDEPDIRLILKDRLVSIGYRVFEAGSCNEMRKTMDCRELDLILLDLNLPDGDGFQILDEILSFEESVEVIVITAYGTIQKAVEAMQHGACDFITKPFDVLDLETRIKKALNYNNLKREAASYRIGQSEERVHPVVGRSKKMTECLQAAHRLDRTDITALLLGETGTGKGVLARHIHANSSRANKPFVVVNCTNFSEYLIEDELFGHEKGAFTGADKVKQGKVEIADGGTLFLDEIGELYRELQVKLLGFLETKRYHRIGGNKERETDVRIISASNRDLARDVQRGVFREDLFYRLNVYPVFLPPLRDRLEDIPDLVNHFLCEISIKQSRRRLAILEECFEILMRYHWPGNVRELRNVLERATVLATDGVIRPEHLIPLGLSQRPFEPIGCKGGYKEQVKEYEKALIRSVLEQTGWNQSESARRLKLNRTHFIRLMNRYGIKSNGSCSPGA